MEEEFSSTGLQKFIELQKSQSHDSSSSSDQERQDENYVLLKFLGKGSFGTVNLYQNTADNSLVVWKEIDLKRFFIFYFVLVVIEFTRLNFNFDLIKFGRQNAK